MQRDASVEGTHAADQADGAAEPRRAASRLLRPTLPELWLFLALALPTMAALVAKLPTVDLAYQLRAGADILAGRGIPAVDSWTFTAAGGPWFDQQWAAQAILAAVYGATGWSGLAILRAALVLTTMAAILVAIRRRAPSVSGRTAALLALGAFIVMAPALALRPQLFGMALFAISLAILAGRHEHPRELRLLPLIAIAWANIHGSFILVPILIGLAWIEDVADRSATARSTLLAGIAATAATAITPFGPSVWSYAIGLARNPDVTGRISEWRPPMPTDVPGALFWVSVLWVVIAIAALARRRRAIPWPAILTLLVFAGLAAIAARGVAWWPAVAAVTVAGLLGNGAADAPVRHWRREPLNAVVAMLIVAAGISVLPLWRPVDRALRAPEGLLAEAAPASITAALRQLATPADRVWNPQVWGSWLEFAVPAPRYALDSRIEIFPSDLWASAEIVAEAKPGWDEILEAAGVTIVVTEDPETSPLAKALERSAGWGWGLGTLRSDGGIWVRIGR